MSNGMPSMLALLGLVAVAGFQNRDKIANALGGLTKEGGAPSGGAGSGSLLGGLGDLLGGSPASGSGSNVLTGGLGQLLDSFKAAGTEKVANSWIDPSVPTEGLTPQQVEAAVGADNLAELSRRTGLSHEQLLERLASAIPATVDQLTPGGRMPTELEVRATLLPTA